MHLLRLLKAGGDVIVREVLGVATEVEHIHLKLLKRLVVFLEEILFMEDANHKKLTYCRWINLYFCWNKSLGIDTILNLKVRAED